eukprot:COSAG06_NODE_11118_length_1564_cov_4.544799_1_plen_67_part_00
MGLSVAAYSAANKAECAAIKAESVAALCYLHNEEAHVAQRGVPPAAAAAALPRARANLQTHHQPTH